MRCPRPSAVDSASSRMTCCQTLCQTTTRRTRFLGISVLYFFKMFSITTLDCRGLVRMVGYSVSISSRNRTRPCNGYPHLTERCRRSFHLQTKNRPIQSKRHKTLVFSANDCKWLSNENDTVGSNWAKIQSFVDLSSLSDPWGI